MCLISQGDWMKILWLQVTCNWEWLLVLWISSGIQSDIHFLWRDIWVQGGGVSLPIFAFVLDQSIKGKVAKGPSRDQVPAFLELCKNKILCPLGMGLSIWEMNFKCIYVLSKKMYTLWAGEKKPLLSLFGVGLFASLWLVTAVTVTQLVDVRGRIHKAAGQKHLDIEQVTEFNPDLVTLAGCLTLTSLCLHHLAGDAGSSQICADSW
jgi:hypothetical protein